MPKRKYVEVSPEVKKDIELFCFLNGKTERQFVTKAIEDKLVPFKPWLKSVRKLKCETFL